MITMVYVLKNLRDLGIRGGVPAQISGRCCASAVESTEVATSLRSIPVTMLGQRHNAALGLYLWLVVVTGVRRAAAYPAKLTAGSAPQGG